MQEVLLHETAVSWLRHRLTETLPAKPWEETPADFGVRLCQCCQAINNKLEVEALCRACPTRLLKLVDNKGGRLEE